jgi:hypothetical protein
MVDNTQYIGFAATTQFMALKVGGTAKMPEAPAGRGFGPGRGAPKGPPPPPPADAGKELHGQDKQ